MKRIVVLSSANGGNLRFLHAARDYGLVEEVELALIADRPCAAVDFCRRVGIPNDVISYHRSHPAELQEALDDLLPDAVVTTWHKILDPDTVRRHVGYLLNLHYSLLPAFAGAIGMEPLRLAYERGCRFAGPTCHLVDEGVDTGKVIAQAAFRTDVPLDQAVPLMFQLGCLVLLAGLREVAGLRFGSRLSTRLISTQADFWISPDMPAVACSDPAPLWRRVAEA